MATAAKVGTNFTGVQMSPKDTKRLLEAVNEIHPDVPGDETGMLMERAERSAEAGRIGSVPVPGSAKGMLKTGFDMMKGKSRKCSSTSSASAWPTSATACACTRR